MPPYNTTSGALQFSFLRIKGNKAWLFYDVFSKYSYHPVTETKTMVPGYESSGYQSSPTFYDPALQNPYSNKMAKIANYVNWRKENADVQDKHL